MALLYNKARHDSKYAPSLQGEFEDSRQKLRTIAKETYDHTALFPMVRASRSLLSRPATLLTGRGSTLIDATSAPQTCGN